MVKTLLGLILLFVATSCANRPPDNEKTPPPTREEVQAREDFAKSLPKPRER